MKGLKEFIEKYGKADSPDMDHSIVELLMDDHFYFLDNNFVLDGGGYYIAKDISGLTKVEKVIHSYCKENCQ